MKIQAMVASGTVDGTGERFSDDALNHMMETCIGKPIRMTVGGNEAGNVSKAWRDGDPLFIEGEVSISFELFSKAIAKKLEEDDKLCLVPMIVYQSLGRHLEGDVMVIDKAEVIGFLMTVRPADSTLTPIQIIQDEGD